MILTVWKYYYNIKGLISVIIGLSGTISSFLCGYMTKLLRIQTILFFMLALAFSNLMLMLFGGVEPKQRYLIYLMAVFFGITNSIGKSQLSGLLGIRFPNNMSSSYSVFSAFESMGFMFGAIVSLFAQTRLKVYICLGLVIASFFGYLIFEIRSHMAKKRSDEKRKELDNQKAILSSSTGIF